MKTTASNAALTAGLYALDLLDPAERQAFLESLAQSPAARAGLDRAEELAAAVSRRAPPRQPRPQVLAAALRQLETAPPGKIPAPHKPRPWLRWGSWAALLAVAGSAGISIVGQQRTIRQLNKELAQEASRREAFPPGRPKEAGQPGGLFSNEPDAANPNGPAASETDLANAAIRSRALPLMPDGNMLVPAQDPTQLRGATARLRKEGTGGPVVAGGSGVDAVFVELRAPGETPAMDNKALLAGVVADHMAAAADALDAPLEPDRKPAVVGTAASEGSFELYEGIVEMGDGILYDRETSLLMVPRGDGRTYDYMKPGPGFDPTDLTATRQRLLDERQKPIAALPETPAPDPAQPGTTAPGEIGAPRAYIYADRESGEGFVVVKRLPPLTEGEVYRVYQNVNAPELIGNLPPEEVGVAEAVLQLPKPAAAGEGFLITREPAGAPGPTPGTIVLKGK
jgi:hypothetical protein